jgi:hypothetical protein
MYRSRDDPGRKASDRRAWAEAQVTVDDRLALTPWASLPATWGRGPVGDVGDRSDDLDPHPVFARARVANKTGRARRRTGVMASLQSRAWSPTGVPPSYA